MEQTVQNKDNKIMQFVTFSTIICFLFSSYTVTAQESTCYGTTKNGRLDNGVKLPSNGENFTSYGSFPELIGRTYVHSRVKNVIVESYNYLNYSNPKKKYKYAETGFKEGGPFKPHKTHQNGLPIDFIVPIIDSKKKNSILLPTNAFNKYGYNVEFDNTGKYKNYKIDFESLAAHLVALHKSALKNNMIIWRVIFYS